MLTTNSCAIKGCTNKTLWQPTINIWAKGFSKDAHPPAKLTPELAYCEEHKTNDASVIIKDLFPDSEKAKLDAVTAKANRVPFNWNSAEVVWIKLKQKPGDTKCKK